jgi:rRNA maturation endonuclease Nob1
MVITNIRTNINIYNRVCKKCRVDFTTKDKTNNLCDICHEQELLLKEIYKDRLERRSKNIYRTNFKLPFEE